MNRDEALALACGGLCVQLHGIMPEALAPARTSHGDLSDTDRTTWLVRNARLMTLIQTAEGTRVYDHEGDFLYYASPNVELDARCPEGHAFLAQAVTDREGDAQVPRLLVLDLVCPRIEDPRRRGSALRAMAHLFPPACHVQWSGERAALERFLARGMPHDVEAVVALREPGCLLRERPAPPGIAALRGLDLSFTPSRTA